MKTNGVAPTNSPVSLLTVVQKRRSASRNGSWASSSRTRLTSLYFQKAALVSRLRTTLKYSSEVRIVAASFVRSVEGIDGSRERYSSSETDVFRLGGAMGFSAICDLL